MEQERKQAAPPSREKGTPVEAVAGTLVTAGRMIAGGSRVVGKQVASLYGTIDPDFGRHLLQIPLLGYSLFPSWGDAIAPGEDDGHPPLVFVHGLGGTGREFRLMAWSLRGAGRRRSYRIRFSPKKSLEEMAGELAGYIREVKQVTGAPKVDVIAHSMGGLVARLAILDHRLGRSVHTLITLGTPHYGTYTARFGGTAMNRALRPDSPLMERLRRRVLTRSVRVITCWSKNDLMVVPGESGALEGAEQVELTPFTHYSYLIDPRCWKTVRAVLAGDTPSETGQPFGASA